MLSHRIRKLAFAIFFVWPAIGQARPAALVGFAAPGVLTQSQTAAAGQASKATGKIKSISGGAIVLSLDDGSEERISVPDSARVLQLAPGQKELKSAVPIPLSGLQPGDRLLVFGKPADDGTTINASIVVAMKSSEIEAAHREEQQEWQRGVGGLVDSVDPASHEVTISVSAPGGSRKIIVDAHDPAVIRRYAAGSVKFSDAAISTLSAIHPGDQLRARGQRSEDGSRFTAVEIVSGSFRNIAGAISAVDAAAKTIRVHDNILKISVLVRISADTELRILPAMAAQRIAMRLKQGPSGNFAPSAPSGDSYPGAAGKTPQSPADGQRGNGPVSLQQVLTRMPAKDIADFHAGDAVMIVATQGSVPGEVTAITVVGGVEPLLTAAPAGSQGLTLSPWNLGSAGAAESEAGAP